MKRRTTDPLAPLMPLARLAAVGFVAAAGTLAAVNVGGPSSAAVTTPASGAGVVLSAHPSPSTKPTTSPSANGNSRAAELEANTLLSEIKVPPGSVAVSTRPGNAPDLGQAPFLPQVPSLITRTNWWSSTLSVNAALDWMRAHPPTGLFPSISGSGSAQMIVFQGNGSGVIDQVTGYAQIFTLPDGETGIQTSSVIVYQPDRPAQETIPTAAKLVAVPDFPGSGGRGGGSAIFTDQTEINRVAQIINALPTASLGTFSCPADNASGLDLKFESSSGTILAQVLMNASGCGGTAVSTAGKQQPTLASGAQTIQEIQDILGTRWQLGFSIP